MGNPFKNVAAHSAEYFGDSRDHWWNADFLGLMAQRWKLGGVESMLDVGCGVGHWSMTLASVMNESVRVTGIDREPLWVAAATERARARGLESRFSYQVGVAERIPFPDDTFDLTTCQTVLIHLPDPSAAIAEMIRVTRPGGRIAVAEPNNLTEALLLDSISATAGVEDVLDLVRLQLTCERGKVSLGEGDNSLGDKVPGLFVRAGIENVEVYVNDKATAIFPPYVADAQRVFADDLQESIAQGLWNWPEEETRRLFMAGGGNSEDFARLFARALASRKDVARGVEGATYHGIVGGVFYFVGGRKPERPSGEAPSTPSEFEPSTTG